MEDLEKTNLTGRNNIMRITGFVAYPASPNSLAQVIREAIEIANRSSQNTFSPWEENDIAGRPLTTPIFRNIEEADILIADITKLNFNVTYEIGYAIGLNRRVYLIRSTEYQSDYALAQRIGIFDTLGYQTYDNSQNLATMLGSITDASPLANTAKPNRLAPVYILETPTRGGVMTRIIGRAKKARLQYRSFTPAEESRLSAMDAINHVGSSFGVLVPLLSSAFNDFDVHNIRAAFIAGLAHGMSIPTLILQDQDGPIPLDVRDFVKTFGHPQDIDGHIHEFSLDVFERTQQGEDFQLPKGKFLSQIVIGDPMAENEFQTLGSYYLQTDEFSRALRGEVNLIVGRKGTGKTALFSQVRNKKRENRKNIVVDLKPEGYQLIKLKEEVLDYLSAGAKAHLITAFWEYLLYLEVCYKVLEKDQRIYMRDPDLYEPYNRLKSLYLSSPNVSEGDFSERLLTLSENLAQEYAGKYGAELETRLTAENVTELLHANDIRTLQSELSNYLNKKGEVWILFDNLDKGWSSQGLARGDIIILRCLIDATRKIQRKMRQDGHEFFAIVFVRNDVYQLLMDQSPDFGKETRASLDWSDPDLLRELLRMRLVQNALPEHASFDQIWAKVCVSHFQGEETSQFLIDRSLMRPRNLLKLFGSCRGFAVNLQHDRIEAHDLEKGLKAYSNDLIVDADQELTDIDPEAKNLIYQFIGESNQFTKDDLDILFDLNSISAENKNKVIEFLLYYGFLGISYHGQEEQYIFNVGYDMQILKTRIVKNEPAIKFVLNPAFWPGLGISIQ